MYIYVLGTWFLANLLHPALLLFFSCYGKDGSDPEPVSVIGAYLFVFVVVLILSLPSLVFSWFTIYIVSRLPIGTRGKFVTWGISASIIPFLNVMIIGGLQAVLTMIMVPSVVAVLLAIIVRYRKFFEVLEITSINDQTI